MKNKQLTWAKTILVAYKYLGTLSRCIDRIINKSALNSFYTGGNWDDKNSVFNISNKILKLTNKKVDYINLKVLVEKILSKMSKDKAKLLILRNIKDLKTSTICNMLNMKERTYYRRTDLALKEFVTQMIEMGFTYAKLDLDFSDDEFIYSIYRIIDNDDLAVVQSCDYQEEYLTSYVYRLTKLIAC